MSANAPPMPALSPTMLVAPVLMIAWKYFAIDTSSGSAGLRGLRFAFIGMVLTCTAALGLLYRTINNPKNKNSQKILIKMDSSSATAPSKQSVTITEYDNIEFKKMIHKHLMSIIVISFLHYKMEVIQPLVLQLGMMPLGIWTSPLLRIHWLGKPSINDLARPFPPPANPFQQLLHAEDSNDAGTSTDNTANPASDKKEL